MAMRSLQCLYLFNSCYGRHAPDQEIHVESFLERVALEIFLECCRVAKNNQANQASEN